MKRDYRLAGIDIGSNAARLLIKNIEVLPDGKLKFTKVLFLRYPLRLGDDVFTIGKISKERAQRMLRMIKAFRQLMLLYDVEHYEAAATSAMREAANGKEVISKIKDKTGIEIQIIDGKVEANMIYKNSLEMLDSNEPHTCAYVDVGGGSTEITLLKDSQPFYSMSYNIGTIRMLHSSEEQNQAVLKQIVYDLKAQCADLGPLNIIGSGGNINKLWKLGVDKKKDNKISVKKVRELHDLIKPLGMDQRMEQFSMKKDRADVIIPAAEIFLTIAETLQSQYFYVPSLGLADGLIDRQFEEARKEDIKE